MSATEDATIAARVPLDLRADLVELVERGEARDLSRAIRAACREWADAKLGKTDATDVAAPSRILNNGRPGAARRRGTPTEKLAALRVAPRAGTARRRALEAFLDAGDRGLTADEVVVRLAPAPHNGTARRVTDLLQGELIGERRLDEGATVYADESYRVANGLLTRRTRAGAWAQVYVITPAGRQALNPPRAQ